jgi:4-carboxymuconolactone decarboxylase
MALSNHHDSAAFSPFEKIVIDYAEAMTRTPQDVPPEVMETLRKELDAAQLVELTAAIAWENYRARFNHALAIESQDFSEGAFCALPERANAHREGVSAAG